ncbi:MAG: lipoprotein insertase outer membrane protein LolB [Candidatus Accumulibacter sp.]|uniref:lipoprotein insertase outer membrane protein LolB n=1 Tax=Accumulibacter sp. TaxID=2053492 RepID=UPI00287A71B1|nr:lipoprotein insertase outer membrane protein LolB [Accumulibacter sp.]MDS4014725.1 lipoprotein insertase outer membrane protein LolB [Accumulibacter sp.]
MNCRAGRSGSRIWPSFEGRWPWLVATLVALAACSTPGRVGDSAATIGRDRLQAFAVAGRFALRQHEASHSGRIYWRHVDGSDHLVVSSPFGQALAEVSGNSGGARLVASDGKTYEAPTMDELLVAVLGYPLPLGKLADWLRGRSRAGVQVVSDSLGRPLAIEDQDWRLRYQYDDNDAQALPGRLFVERAQVFELRLRIDEWTDLAR